MKKIIIALLVGMAMSANAQRVIQFTNNCNYKIALQSVQIDNLRAVEDESGDWVAKGLILYSLPPQFTNTPSGVTMRGDTEVIFLSRLSLYVTAAEIAAKSGSNELVKVNKVLKDKVRTLGSNLKAELSQ